MPDGKTYSDGIYETEIRNLQKDVQNMDADIKAAFSDLGRQIKDLPCSCHTTEIATLKTNWKWIAGIAGFIGSALGVIAGLVVQFFKP